jgi:hypothetical protein
MPALYTALAVLGWVSLCALIAWFVGRVLDFAAQLFDDEDGKVADAWGDFPALHEELTGRRNGGIGRGEGAYRAGADPSHSTLTHTHTLTRHVVHGREA